MKYLKLFLIEIVIQLVITIVVVQFVRGYADGVAEMRQEMARLEDENKTMKIALQACRDTTNTGMTWPRYKQVRLSGEMLVYFAGSQR